jgi:predicted nucleic acid-binding protein
MGSPGELERKARRVAAIVSEPICDCAFNTRPRSKMAEAMVAARRNGRPIETADAWVAATALVFDAPLLTHDKADYIGVPGLRFSWSS